MKFHIPTGDAASAVTPCDASSRIPSVVFEVTDLRRLLAGLASLGLLIATLLGMAPRSPSGSFGECAVPEFDDAHDATDVSRRLERLSPLPTLTVNYFRGNGHYSEAWFVVGLPSHHKVPSGAPPAAKRLFGRIRALETNARLAQSATDIVLEREHWTATRANPLLHQSSALLLPGRYWFQLVVDDAGTSDRIDRILEVPSFPEQELGISSVIAVSETEPYPANAAALSMLSPKVNRRFRRGQPFVIFAEVYPAASPDASIAFSVRFVLSRGEHVVRDKTYDLQTSESKVPFFETFETKSLEPGPYLLQAKVSLASGEESISSRLELTIDDASP